MKRSRPIRSGPEERYQPVRELHGDLPQREHRARARRKLDPEVVAQIIVELLQRFDQQVVERKPDWAAPVGIAAEEAAGGLGRFVVDAEARAADVENVGVGFVKFGERAHAVRTQELILGKEPLQDSAQAVGVDDRQQTPLAHAADFDPRDVLGELRPVGDKPFHARLEEGQLFERIRIERFHREDRNHTHRRANLQRNAFARR